MMTSRMLPSLTRRISPATSMSSGPTPRSGESAPRRTWKTPLKSRVCSIVAMLYASSTTQITDGSRRASLQIAHGSTSVMLLQTEQRKIFCFTSMIALASASASAGVRLRMWYASRDADLAPMPGSFVSSLIRLASGGAVNSEQSRDLHPAGHGAEGRLHLFVDLARRFVDRGDDEVVQHLDVVRIDRFLVDRHGEELLRAVHGRLHHPAARAPLDAQLGHPLRHLRLHLLHLLHELFGVHFVLLLSTMSAPRCFGNARTTGSSRSADGLSSARRLWAGNVCAIASIVT